MTVRFSTGQSIHQRKSKISAAISILGLVIGAGGLTLAMAIPANANTNIVSGCSFDISATTWTLQSNCSSTAEFHLSTGVTLNGDNFTISPTFTKSGNSNNAAIGISGSNNVTIQDLNIDGTASINLHGINIYESTGVTIDHVAVRNMPNSGIVANSSTVTVSNVTTSNNGWNGINVDQKVVAVPAILNIVGPMKQTDAAQILVDDIQRAVTVNDVNHQYAVMYFTKDGLPAAAYVLYRTGKESCKDGGWNLGLNSTQSFKNQGQCVAFFADGDKKSHSDESGDKSKSGNEKG